MSVLERIVALAQKQLALEAKKAELEKETKAINKELEAVRGGHQAEGELPQAMQEAEMAEFKLENGAKITIEEQLVPPSMAKDSTEREPMLRWVDEKGHGDVVKNSIIVLFPKGDKRADRVRMVLKDEGLDYEDFATIHPSTLKALLKELMEAGEDVPTEDLGIRVFRQSKVK